jgi:hypothetical protein
MKLSFREFYNEYGGGYGSDYGYGGGYGDGHYGYQRGKWMQNPYLGVPAASYLGYALGGPVGALAAGAGAYGYSKLMGGGRNAEPDPTQFIYSRNPYTGKVERQLPNQPDIENMQDMTDDEIDQYNNDYRNAYSLYRDNRGVHSLKKSQHQMDRGYRHPQQPQRR